MTSVTDDGWTLHYTIGDVLAAKVVSGDMVHMPCGRADLIVLAGRAPRRVNDRGSVIVRDPRTEELGGFEVNPGTLGMVWISAAGGWSQLLA